MKIQVRGEGGRELPLLWAQCQLQTKSGNGQNSSLISFYSFSHIFSHLMVPAFPGTYGLSDFMLLELSHNVISLACWTQKVLLWSYNKCPNMYVFDSGLPILCQYQTVLIIWAFAIFFIVCLFFIVLISALYYFIPSFNTILLENPPYPSHQSCCRAEFHTLFICTDIDRKSTRLNSSH